MYIANTACSASSRRCLEPCGLIEQGKEKPADAMRRERASGRSQEENFERMLTMLGLLEAGRLDCPRVTMEPYAP